MIIDNLTIASFVVTAVLFTAVLILNSRQQAKQE